MPILALVFFIFLNLNKKEPPQRFFKFQLIIKILYLKPEDLYPLELNHNLLFHLLQEI